VAPIHASSDLKRKTLSAVLEDAGLTLEEFRELL
jgi:predicted RNA binding protein YcfA (HicA-like mRNA interferase family)